MSSLTFFLAVVVSLQIAQDGVHSCVLRSHREKVAGLQPGCSIPGAADPTSANSRHTVAPCATPKLGLQYPDVLNKIPRPGSDLINPAVPSDRLLPSLSSTPAAHITAPPPGVIAVPNAKIEATAAAAAIVPVDVPKSTTLPETASTISEPSRTSPATDSNSVSANAAVQSSDPGSADVAAVAPVNSSSDSSIVAPETSSTALEPAASPEPAPAPVSNTVPAADSVSPSTSAVESLEPLSQPPSNNTTPSIV